MVSCSRRRVSARTSGREERRTRGQTHRRVLVEQDLGAVVEHVPNGRGDGEDDVEDAEDDAPLVELPRIAAACTHSSRSALHPGAQEDGERAAHPWWKKNQPSCASRETQLADHTNEYWMKAAAAR